MRRLLIGALVASAAAMVAGLCLAVLGAGLAPWSVGLGVLGLVVFLVVAWIGSYVDDWRWTGIGPPRVRETDGTPLPSGKTLWDALQLVIIPGILVFGVWWLNDQQSTSARISADRQATATTINAQDQAQNAVLDTYFDRMSDLLLKQHLDTARFPVFEGRFSLAVSAATSVARARTVTALSRLDKRRRNVLTGFLLQTGLLRSGLLAGTDLSGANLTDINLSGAKLTDINLSQANLSSALLDGVDLSNAGLSGANLRMTILSDSQLCDASLGYAQLEHSDLARAHLCRAALFSANMSHAYLLSADLTDANLASADLRRAILINTRVVGVTWENTICPDGTRSDTNGTRPQSCVGHLKWWHFKLIRAAG